MRAAYRSLLLASLTALLVAADTTDAPPRGDGVHHPGPRLGHPSGETPAGQPGPPGAAAVGKGGNGSGKGTPAKASAKDAKPKPKPAGAGEGKTADAKPADTTTGQNPIDNDTVILTNEQRFQGTVLSDQSDPDSVAINTGTGVLRIRRELVAKVEYGLVSRMGKVKNDDLGGLVDLANWCRINRRNPEALQLLTKAVALPGCDIKTRGLYAQLVDEIDGPEKALPLYVAYRNGGGTDPDILARLDVLEKAHQAWADQMRALGLDPGAGSDPATAVAAATSSSIDEGLEKYKWVGDDPKWANPVTTSQPTLTTESGPRKVLQVDYGPNPTTPGIDKAAVVLRPQGGLNVRAGAKLTLLAANRSAKDVRLAIAVKTGNDWTYYESQVQPLPATSSGQEFVQLSFDLGAATFKAAATNWAHSAKVANLDQVREVQVLIHNGREKGSLWLAGIAFADGQ